MTFFKHYRLPSTPSALLSPLGIDIEIVSGYHIARCWLVLLQLAVTTSLSLWAAH